MLADLAPTPLAMAVQVSCSLVTTVLSGVVIASQEFRLQSLVYFSGLVLVFTPIVLIVANDPEIEMSIAWLLWATLRVLPVGSANQDLPGANSPKVLRGGAPSSGYPLLHALQSRSLAYVDAAAEFGAIMALFWICDRTAFFELNMKAIEIDGLEGGLDVVEVGAGGERGQARLLHLQGHVEETLVVDARRTKVSCPDGVSPVSIDHEINTQHHLVAGLRHVGAKAPVEPGAIGLGANR